MKLARLLEVQRRLHQIVTLHLLLLAIAFKKLLKLTFDPENASGDEMTLPIGRGLQCSHALVNTMIIVIHVSYDQSPGFRVGYLCISGKSSTIEEPHK